MSAAVALVALSALVVGWALWQRRRDPYLLLRGTPEWQAMVDAAERAAATIGASLLPAMRSLALAAADAADAIAQLDLPDPDPEGRPEQ